MFISEQVPNSKAYDYGLKVCIMQRSRYTGSEWRGSTFAVEVEVGLEIEVGLD